MMTEAMNMLLGKKTKRKKTIVVVGKKAKLADAMAKAKAMEIAKDMRGKK